METYMRPLQDEEQRKQEREQRYDNIHKIQHKYGKWKKAFYISTTVMAIGAAGQFGLPEPHKNTGTLELRILQEISTLEGIKLQATQADSLYDIHIEYNPNTVLNMLEQQRDSLQSTTESQENEKHCQDRFSLLGIGTGLAWLLFGMGKAVDKYQKKQEDKEYKAIEMLRKR